jgi:hypothetical protein
MTPLIVVLGIVGAILLLVGLVGGDFTLSGKFMPQVGMPKIGNWVRLPCFSVGAVLVVVAIGLGVAYSPLQTSTGDGGPSTPPAAAPAAATSPATSPSPSSSPTPTDTSNEIATGTVVAPSGDTTLYVFQQPSLSSQNVAEIAGGTTIGILCTAQGDVITNSDTGESSSLWDRTSEGFVPDVYVDTGTNQPTMGSC